MCPPRTSTMRRRPLRLATSALTFAAVFALHACAGDEPAPDTHPGFEDVLLQGDVTGDTLSAFVRAMEISLPRPGGPELVFTWPVNNEKIKEAEVHFLTVCWALAPTAEAPRPPPAAPRSPGLLDWEPGARSPSWAAPLAAPLADLLGPRLAHAEPSGYEGMVTFAVLSTSDDPALIRVLTSEFDYNPTSAELARMAAAPQPITVRLVTAFVTPGKLLARGPFLGPELTFSIVP